MKSKPDRTKLQYIAAAARTGFCVQYQRRHHSIEDLAEWSVKTARQAVKQLGLTNEDLKELSSAQKACQPVL